MYDSWVDCDFFSCQQKPIYAIYALDFLNEFLPEASFGLWVLSSPVSVCVSVCVCESVCQSLACLRDNLVPVQARIAKFGPTMQKTLVKVPIVLGGNILWPSRSNLTSKSEFTQFELVRTITHHPFKLGSLNLDQRWKIAWWRYL